MITINAHKGKMIELKVTGENFHKDLDFIKKQLIGRKYNAETKMWEIPIIKANFKILEKAKKHFDDHDALWAFEDEDYETFLTVNKVGDNIELKSFYDEKLVDIIKSKKSKEDKWDKEKWNLTGATWKAIKQKIIDYMKESGEKYEINA